MASVHPIQYGSGRGWLGPFMLAALLFVLSAWTWRAWPDVLVDFGYELYVPWQLSEGKVLYRDLICLRGPFSQYFNALAFKVFGVSFSTLIFSNLAVLTGLVTLVYSMFATAYDRATAVLGCLALLTLFAFGHYTLIGNYNFVAPYSHEATHGVALSVAMMWCLTSFAIRRRARLLAVAGLCLGCALLTRPDVSVAAIVAALLGIGSVLLMDGRLTARTTSAFGLFALMALLPALCSVVYFWIHLPLPEAVRAVGGSWTALLDSEIAKTAFYRRGMGLERPLPNLFFMLAAFGAIAAFAAVAAVLDVALGRALGRRPLLDIALCAALALALFRFLGDLPWFELPRSLPVVAALACIASAMRLVKHRRDTPAALRILPRVMWAGFALTLLAKIPLAGRFHHYGFYLAMPATLTLVAAFSCDIPLWLRSRFGRGDLFRSLSLVALAAVGFLFVRQSYRWYDLKTVPLARGGDRIMTYDPRYDPSGLAVGYALEAIERYMPADANFVVLPEGVMLNYLSRRRNPTRFISFMVPEMLFYGEEAMLESLEAAHPDFIILVHKDTSEYGVGYFGSDPHYGRSIMDWVQANYSGLMLIGAEPLQSERFGIKILKRSPTAVGTVGH